MKYKIIFDTQLFHKIMSLSKNHWIDEHRKKEITELLRANLHKLLKFKAIHEDDE